MKFFTTTTKTILVTSALLYALAFSYTWVYWDQVAAEFDNGRIPRSTVVPIFEIAAILLYRLITNVLGVTVAAPLAVANQMITGLHNSVLIIVAEFGNIPDILNWIFNSWIVRWIWDTVTAMMVTIGHILEFLYV